MKEDLVEKVTAIVERAGRDEGIEPVEVQWLGSGQNRLMRIYIDKPAGVTHGDCERISEYVGAVLDGEDLVPGGRYTLEVSSPGLERKLVRPKDFERCTGKRVKIVLKRGMGPDEGPKFWEGTLAGVQDGVIRLAPAQGAPVEIPLEMVERANLKFDW